MCESVLLPAPFSPSSACTSPSRASKSTPSLATTPGKRLVIPCNATAAPGGAAAARWSVIARAGLALGAPDHALDEPVHGVEVLHRHLLPGGHLDLAALVLERAGELVERAVDDRRLLLGDRRLRRGRHPRPVRGQLDEAVLDAAVVEARLPGAVHRRLDALLVVAAPVVDGRGEPRRLRELHRVRVVADP